LGLNHCSQSGGWVVQCRDATVLIGPCIPVWATCLPHGLRGSWLKSLLPYARDIHSETCFSVCVFGLAPHSGLRVHSPSVRAREKLRSQPERLAPLDQHAIDTKDVVTNQPSRNTDLSRVLWRDYCGRLTAGGGCLTAVGCQLTAIAPEAMTDTSRQCSVAVFCFNFHAGDSIRHWACSRRWMYIVEACCLGSFTLQRETVEVGPGCAGFEELV